MIYNILNKEKEFVYETETVSYDYPLNLVFAATIELHGLFHFVQLRHSEVHLS